MGTEIAKSVKVSWIKKARENDTISYTREAKRPIALYNMFVNENIDMVSSNIKNATVFFTKNDVICVKRYSTFKTKIVPLYCHKNSTYDLVEIDDSHIEHVNSVKEYVKTPKGEICLLYNVSEFIPVEHKSKTGIYNFDKRKIIYEAKTENVYNISYPLANSIAVVLRLSGDKSTIYIDIVNLLDDSRYEIAYPIKDYLRKLVKDQVNNVLDSIDIEEYRHFVRELINGLSATHPLVSEKISISQVYYEDYKIDLSLDGVIFYKSFTIHIVVKYKIKGEEHSLEIHHALILCCSLEEGELFVMFKPHNTCHWKIKFKYIATDVPAQVLLEKKYNIGIHGSFANSCLYDVTDLFDDYVIVKSEIRRLNSRLDDKNDDSSGSDKLLNTWRLGNINIYEVSESASSRLLVRFRTKVLKELCNAKGYIVQDETQRIKVLDLNRLCDLLIKNQYKPVSSTKQHIDVTKYVINIDTRPLMSSSQVSEVCEGLVHKHKIYFDSKNGNVYLFLSVIKYDPNTKAFSACIPIYRYRIGAHGNKWVNILTLGPYTYTSQELPKNALLPFIVSDIVKARYNVLLYSDFLTNLVEEKNKKDNLFLSTDNIKFKFEDTYIEITDVTYNRRMIFVDNAYDKSRISSRVKQDDKVVVCLDYVDDEKMAYKPFVLSGMELVKPLLYYT